MLRQTTGGPYVNFGHPWPFRSFGTYQRDPKQELELYHPGRYDGVQLDNEYCRLYPDRADYILSYATAYVMEPQFEFLRVTIQLNLSTVNPAERPEIPQECRCVADGKGNWVIQLRSEGKGEWDLLRLQNVNYPILRKRVNLDLELCKYVEVWCWHMVKGRIVPVRCGTSWFGGWW